MSTLRIEANAGVTVGARSAYQAPDRAMQLMCIWTGPVATVLALLGMVFISGFIPATSPAASGQEIADFYTGNLAGIRVGMVISMIAFSLFVPFGIAIALQTRRIEQVPVMSWIQIASVAIAALEGVMAVVIWLAAAFRPDVVDPDLTRALHDLGWICFLVDVPPFSIWIGAVGVAILRDRNAAPLFARWVGYFNLWVAVLILPALLIPFFKTGPFAYNGVLALYLPFGVFFLWMVVMTPALLRALGTPTDKV
jgi:hypothetical protein